MYWRDHELAPRDEQEALLLSEVFALGTGGEESLLELANLSDRFDRSEALEFNLMMAALRQEQEGDRRIGPDLTRRIKETFEQFPEKFPDSEQLQSFVVDSEDAAGSFLAEIQPQLEERAEKGRELSEELSKGVIATAVVASVSGHSIGEVWMSLGAMPLGYSDAQTEAREQAAAAAAVDELGAVWDPTSIFVVGGLTKSDRLVLRAALPASTISESTFADISVDVAKPRGTLRNISLACRCGVMKEQMRRNTKETDFAPQA